MRNMLRSLAISSTAVLLLVLVSLPALAAETGGEKSQIFTRSPHSTVGAFILVACALMVGAAVANAIQQLRGKRRQADGKFRWR